MFARRQRTRNEVTKACALCVTTWLCRSCTSRQRVIERRKRATLSLTSQRERASWSLIVNAWKIASDVPRLSHGLIGMHDRKPL